MSKKLALTASAILIMAVLASGCWSARELNELAIGLGMSIDKAGKNYVVTVQVINTSAFQKQGGIQKANVLTYDAKAESIFEALRKMTTVAPRSVFLSHLRLLVLGEKLAKEGIGEALELVSRDHEFRSDFYIVLAKGVPASDVLKVTTSLEQSPSEKTYKSLEVSESRWAPTHGVFLDELINGMAGDGKSAVLTVIYITGPVSKGQKQDNIMVIDPPVRIKLDGLGVFKHDKLVGWFNEKESKGVNYINGNVKNTVGRVKCPNGGHYMVEVQKTDSEVKGSFRNGKPEINIYITGEGNVGEVDCAIDLTKNKTIEEMEKELNKRSQDVAKSAIKKAKKLKVDVFQFGQALHRASPKEWRTIEEEWPDLIVDTEIKVHSDFKIQRTGTINNSFLDKVKGE